MSLYFKISMFTGTYVPHLSHFLYEKLGGGGHVFWLGGPKVRNHWEDLGVGGRITLS